jgi:hypothetical protein
MAITELADAAAGGQGCIRQIGLGLLKAEYRGTPTVRNDSKPAKVAVVCNCAGGWSYLLFALEYAATKRATVMAM